MLRCPNCKEKVARFPLKDANGKLIVKNLFKMDLMSIIWFIVVITLVITYKGDIKKCEEMVIDPLGYCEDSNACQVLEEKKDNNLFGLVSIDNIPEINVSG